MNALYKFFTSVKLAVGLLVYLIAVSILATLIPQGKDAAFYYHNFSFFWARIIEALHFDSFFRSFFFLFPSGLFFVNLAVCSVDRFFRRQRHAAKRRYGPDLIHIGLLLLIIGGTVTSVARQEGFVFLGEGDQVGLPGNYLLQLNRFEFQQYEDGRPKDWISHVTVEKDGETIVESFPIEVNRPLKVAGVKVFQTSYDYKPIVDLAGARGQLLSLRQGKGFQSGEDFFIFTGIDSSGSVEKAVFEKWRGQERKAVLTAAPQESVADFRVRKVGTIALTGLTAVSDPGFLPVIVAIILLSLGMALTIYQKIGDKKI